MNFIRSLWKSYVRVSIQEFDGAGCLFTDGSHVLAGYHPRKLTLSGLGGKREGTETKLENALRETVEELFDCEAPTDLIEELKKIVYQRILMNGTYIIVVYSFSDLDKFLHVSSKYIKSKLYDDFPLNIMELIFNRKMSESEITKLALLPLEIKMTIDKNFSEDLKIL
jgi:hypothetical protein